jgi:MFS family permease
MTGEREERDVQEIHACSKLKRKNSMDTLQLLAVFTGSIAALLGLCVMPIVMGFRAERRKRECEHLERMKALELGRRLPGEEVKARWAVPYQIAVSIGSGVPGTAFGCAWLATMTTGYHEAMWIAAAIAGLGGAICGTILAATVYTKSGSMMDEMEPTGKPYVHEDAYDVVSSRG